VFLSKFHYIWHTIQITENNKMLFVNKSICNFILQVIRNFTVEYDFEMKFNYGMLRTPATPLKFRMTDREGWRSPINFSALYMTVCEHIIWLEKVACNTEIKFSAIHYNKFSENWIWWRTCTMRNIGTRNYENNAGNLLISVANMRS
jgi:hypothetical protein